MEPPHEHTEDELRSFRAPVLVELVMEAREHRNELAQRCGQLAAALVQATASLDALEHQTHVVQAAQEREYYLISAETTSQNGELQHKAKMLELENCKLQDELAALAVSEQQNRVLRQTLDNVRNTAARDAAAHEKEMRELRESMMEKKSRLQQEYKQLVQTKGLSNSHRPSQDVSLEFLESSQQAAKKAEAQNYLDALVSKQEKLEERCSKMEMQLSMNKGEEEAMTQELLARKKQVHMLRSQVADLQKSLAEKDVQVNIFKEMVHMGPQQLLQLNQTQQRCDLLQHKATCLGRKARRHADTVRKLQSQLQWRSSADTVQRLQGHLYNSKEEEQVKLAMLNSSILPTTVPRASSCEPHQMDTRDGEESGKHSAGKRLLTMKSILPAFPATQQRIPVMLGDEGADDQEVARIWKASITHQTLDELGDQGGEGARETCMDAREASLLFSPSALPSFPRPQHSSCPLPPSRSPAKKEDEERKKEE